MVPLSSPEKRRFFVAAEVGGDGEDKGGEGGEGGEKDDTWRHVVIWLDNIRECGEGLKEVEEAAKDGEGFDGNGDVGKGEWKSVRVGQIRLKGAEEEDKGERRGAGEGFVGYGIRDTNC